MGRLAYLRALTGTSLEVLGRSPGKPMSAKPIGVLENTLSKRMVDLCTYYGSNHPLGAKNRRQSVNTIRQRALQSHQGIFLYRSASDQVQDVI